MGRRSFSAALNRYVKEVEKEERARQREIAREQKYQEKIYKQKIRERKEQAKNRGYITSGKDPAERMDDASRSNASLRDYVFYQFFALDDELDELTDEQSDEIIYDKKNTIVEWRADNIPVMEFRPIDEEPEIKEKNFIGISWIVFIIILILLWRLIPDDTATKSYPDKPISKQADTMPVSVYSDIDYSTHNSSFQNNNKNVELSEEDLRQFNKANARYERNLKKYNKKMERKAEKQEQKLAKRALKEEKKELKKQKKEAKKNKKKDKE